MMQWKKILALLLAAALTLSLAACGGDSGSSAPSSAPSETPSESVEPTNTPEPEESEEPEREVPGTYESASLFQSIVYEWHDNGTYDRQNTEEKGTYTVQDDGTVSTKENGGTGSDTYAPHGDYYYRTSSICNFYKDKEYGLAPTFDDNGHSSQSFDAFYEMITNDKHHYVQFQMNEDGTYVLKDLIRSNTQGLLGKGITYEGTYELKDDVLMLTYDGVEFPFLYLDGNLYFDVLEKVTDDTAKVAETRREARKAASEARWTPADETLAAQVMDQFQGTWEYTQNGFKYELAVEGDHISVTSSVSGNSISNEGTYIVCEDVLLITYQTGGRATIAYSMDNGELSFYPLEGVEN